MNDGIVENVVQGEKLTGAPTSRSDIRIPSPERIKAAKRGTDKHDEEPIARRVILEEIDMDEDDGIDIDSLAARREYQLILYRAMLGHDLTET